MSQAAAYCYTEPNRRVSVHLELDGSAIVQAISLQGEVIETWEDKIDPEDCKRLIAELFDVVPNLPSDPQGDIWVSLYHNDERWDYQLREVNVPKRGLDVGRVIRLIAADTIAGRQQRSNNKKRGGPRDTKMSVGGFLLWTLFFMIGFFAAMVLGILGQFLGGMIGPMAASISITISAFLMEGSFYTVGVKFGEEYRREFPVWPVALTAAAACFGVFWYFIGLGSLCSIGFFLAAPGLAHWGYTTAT